MDDKNILEIVSAPGSVAVALLYLHSRINRLESSVESLMSHVGAPPAERKKNHTRWRALLFALVASACVALAAL